MGFGWYLAALVYPVIIVGIIYFVIQSRASETGD
ncbi:hypothetical protein SAMN05421752_10688 [Natronorubrum thiooxidans]|uniref:Uncharacterized protein n=1 Tax=Natronorubrum thiooxidans TaxID=308853 RepID=A0A1N7F918_9EURY|nr:hypothetical protein SAMN05421752_10688 [Natronorubrum thiooxidans]